MLHYAYGPAQHSRVAPIAARILSSNAGERGPRTNAECGNYLFMLGLKLNHVNKSGPRKHLHWKCTKPTVVVGMFLRT